MANVFDIGLDIFLPKFLKIRSPCTKDLPLYDLSLSLSDALSLSLASSMLALYNGIPQTEYVVLIARLRAL